MCKAATKSYDQVLQREDHKPLQDNSAIIQEEKFTVGEVKRKLNELIGLAAESNKSTLPNIIL